MQWLAENWFLVLFGGGMIAMHLFGHGHGGHGKKKPDEVSKTNAAPETDRQDEH
ncbi:MULTISPECIES: hypothetical protein [Sulfitobacter]|jgi:hypothetical protein|uniref:DUF2933 domain-containing protein n=1 Tax=Sulfitobacter geojensis TaxID=1342299 RepID=A0AAE2W1R9_9RHOB|nr:MULTISPECIES: hypothetical protein [Sulfitobacter]MBM1691364.1 hypothetical protein [Sulfitobacter geojensis]MBM1695430.1 hypothetical protein [Sulfitobacter geojensis]MBM1707618.1 hypothetical protein [Sulfitobacter geojensis]MBM1711680.1 hypothetical protein [Sulfitobacter geojensis]MBM1715743.1 hypothetical protein [Sulfitobacter geojensis]